MKCPMNKCTGQFRTMTSYDVRGRTRKRRRKCDKCGFEDYTIEVSARDYERMRKLIVNFKVLIKDYLQK